MEEEGGRNRGREGRREREGVVWWWNHTHEWPTKCEGLLASLIAICTLLQDFCSPIRLQNVTSKT